MWTDVAVPPMVNGMQRIALAFLALGATAFADGIEWSKDLATAQAQAARDGRPVLLYFTFDT